MKQFKESLTTAVFTTRYIIEGSPILLVYHDDDGSWQFHGPEEDVKDEDIRLVGLGEIIDLDSSILELADLPVGFEATRASYQAKWNIMNSD